MRKATDWMNRGPKTKVRERGAMNGPDNAPLVEAIRWPTQATTAAKCWPCGCLHGSLQALGAPWRRF